MKPTYASGSLPQSALTALDLDHRAHACLRRSEGAPAAPSRFRGLREGVGCRDRDDDHHGCDPRVTGQAAGQQLEQVVQVANHADLPMIVEMVASWIRDQRQIWILPVQLSVSRAGTVVVLLAGPWALLIILGVAGLYSAIGVSIPAIPPAVRAASW